MMVGAELTIRSFRLEDTDRLLDIWLAASRLGHPFLSEDELLRQMALVRDLYLPKAENWVAVEDIRSVGFIGLLDNFIGGLFVDPSCHGRGIGSALIRHAANLKGPLEVEVYAANPIAPDFYRRLGFFETGRRPIDDEGRPLELIRMRLSHG